MSERAAVPASAGTAARHCLTVQVLMRVGGAQARPTSAHYFFPVLMAGK